LEILEEQFKKDSVHLDSGFRFFFISGMDTAESPTKTQAGEDENYSLLCQAHEQFNK